MKTVAILLAPLAFAASLASAAPPPVAQGATARIGQTVLVHGVAVTPLRVLEDSRCPKGVGCVWAGRVRLSARIGRTVREMTLGQPVTVPGGVLKLAAVLPENTVDSGRIAPAAYRFGFRFESRGTTELIRN
jgi:hypothetical protein